MGSTKSVWGGQNSQNLEVIYGWLLHGYNAILAVKAVIATERKNGSLKNLVDAEILFNIVQTDL